MGPYARGIFRIARKKIFLGAIVALVLIIGIGFFLFRSNAIRGESAANELSLEKAAEFEAANAVIAQAFKDSDHDGLKDWEEALYHTDFQNPDTDGDTTSDGEETKQNRDPSQKGPNDKIIPALTDTSGETALDIDPKNLTQNFTKTLFESGALSAINENGEITSLDFLQNLQLSDSLTTESLFANLPAISKTDLKIIDTSDVTIIRNYFTAVGAIYQKNLGAFSESDVIIFTTALERGDYGSLEKLDEQSRAIGKSAEEIKKLSVPASYADTTVQEIKNLYEIKRAIELMRNTAEDPLAAYFAFQKRIDLIDQMTESTKALHDDLVKKGVITP